MTNAGRVELYFNGEWSTICNDGWDDTDASVVCRQLGFGLSGVTLQPEPGRGLILLDDVNCFGNESSLLNCEHSGIGISNCDHSKDAGVNCTESLPGNSYYLIYSIVQNRCSKFLVNQFINFLINV